jgi:hypothetical protein
VLSGVTYSAVRGRSETTSVPQALTRVWARWMKRPSGAPRLYEPWALVDTVQHELARDEAAGVWRADGIPVPPAAAGLELQLLVVENERTPADVPGVSDYEERVVYADAVPLQV